MFYLDNLKLGSDTRPHDNFPRIMDFYSDCIQRLVLTERKAGYMSSLDMCGLAQVTMHYQTSRNVLLVACVSYVLPPRPTLR